METSSYLFMSKRKRYNISSRIMEKHSSSDSNLSTDSLENSFKKERKQKNPSSEDNVETILVPFYENDVLIKVPKEQKKKQKQESSSKLRRDLQISNSYLIKKDVKKVKRTSYLEMFRKQFGPTKVEQLKDEREIRSISPEYGDTERESIGDDDNNAVSEFYNTESYNEMYYEKILSQDIGNYLENSFEEGLRFTENLRSKSPDDSADNNLKSISEVSQPRRQRRATVQPIQNVKLGGLGPDMEKIKPRLERARSLQRYSEKVRMENRLKIYKRSVQDEIEKKSQRETSARKRESAKEIFVNEQNASYLVNKSMEDNNSNLMKKYHGKSKSAGIQKIRDRIKDKELLKDERSKIISHERENMQLESKEEKKSVNKSAHRRGNDKQTFDTDNDSKIRSVRSSARNRGINTDKEQDDTPPVQINFLFNVGGLRPSTALRSLEEKHKMYQEQVKGFSMDSKNA